MIHPTPRDALLFGLGAFIYPMAEHITLTLLGRNVFDPDYRRKPK